MNCSSTGGGNNVIENHSASSGNYTISGHRERVTNLVWVSSVGEKKAKFKVAQLFHKVAQFVATNVVFKDCNIAQKVGKHLNDF